MAQYDLLLTQNTAPSGVEYSEKIVNIAKGGLLTANASGVPSVLPVGTDTYHLVANSAAGNGLGIEWVVQTGGHSQNTDVGTTSTVFELDSDGFKIELTAESASKAGVKVDGGATYADFQAKDGTFNIVTVGSAAPTGAYELTHKTYVDGLFASNDALLFKGTIGTGGTHTIAAFNALTTYNAGWTYRVIEAGTIRGLVCEIGDLVMVIVDRTGSGNVNADFTVAQTNLDGAVIGPASTTDNYVALFSGTTGKLLKAGTGALGSAAYSASSDYIKKTGGSTDGAFSGAIFEAKGADIASATTTDIGAATGNYLDVTGVTTITGLGTCQAGTRRIVRFTGALILTHNGTSLMLPGAANITTVAGDVATFVSLGAGNWKCVDYLRNSGKPVVMPTGSDVGAVAASTFTATGNEFLLGSAASTYAALAIAASRIVGRKASGNVVGMTANETLALLWASQVAMGTAPASKTATGVQGDIAFDGNYLFVCTAANTWKRIAMATNW